LDSGLISASECSTFPPEPNWRLSSVINGEVIDRANPLDIFTNDLFLRRTEFGGHDHPEGLFTFLSRYLGQDEMF